MREHARGIDRHRRGLVGGILHDGRRLEPTERVEGVVHRAVVEDRTQRAAAGGVAR